MGRVASAWPSAFSLMPCIFFITICLFATKTRGQSLRCPENTPIVPEMTCSNAGNITCATFNNTGQTLQAPQCQCKNGWTGVQCRQCVTNAQCSNDDSYICDRTHIPWLQKTYGCVADDSGTAGALNGGSIEFILYPDAVSNKNGTATVWSWQYEKGQPLKWTCSAQLCVMSTTRNMLFDCANSTCKCGSANFVDCPPWNNANAGRMVFECTSALQCALRNPAALGESEYILQCSTGECMIPVDNRSTIAAIIIVPIVILLAAFPFIAYAILMCKWRSLGSQSLEKDEESTRGLALSVKNLKYFVYDSVSWIPFCGKKKEVEILRDLTFSIKPAKVTALIGVAGAGKTTLLDILAGFEKKGKVRGSLTLDGKPLPSTYRYLVGYVLAEDKLLGTLTVYEQLMYTAHLRLPPDTPLAKKQEIVEDIIKDLGLTKVRDTRIGDEAERGVSGGEKRRVSIATQLVTSPRILILDEPTTGLDAYNALVVMQTLQKLAKRGTTVVCSIHQPRSDILPLVDESIVLFDGRLCYAGKTHRMKKFFSSAGFECPHNFNIADFVIDTTTLARDDEIDELVRLTHKKIKKDVGQKGDDDGLESEEDGHNQHQAEHFATGWVTQLAILSHRSFINFIRSWTLLRTHVIAEIALAIFIGLTYLGGKGNVQGVQNLAGSLFFQISLFSFACISTLDLFMSERLTFIRERANHSYRTSAYFLAKLATDLVPLRIILPIIYCLVTYWIIGYQNEVFNVLRFIIIMIATNFVAASFMMFLATMMRTVASATVIATLILLIMLLFGGFVLNVDSIPPFLGWIRFLSWFLYAYEAIVGSELGDLMVFVDLPGVPQVTIPGAAFLKQFGLSPAAFGRNLAILAGFGVFYLILAYVLLRLFVKYKQ